MPLTPRSLLTDLRYPIGLFDHGDPVSDGDLARWIDQIETLPDQMRRAVTGLTDSQLDTPYRPGGWTLRQVIHHVPDSHLNSYVRFKWALTEGEPTIKAYDEQRWAELTDYRTVPIETNLDFLTLLHAKWVALLRSLSREQLSRRFVHPVSGPADLARTVGSYAWHGRHHLAHITTTIERKGWQPVPHGTSMEQVKRTGADARMTIQDGYRALHAAAGAEFVRLFCHGSLEVEFYKPDGVDRQQPHTRDEIYVVASGTGHFVNGDQRHPFELGEVLFVPASVEHRFVEFTDDFATWVFFYGPEGGEAREADRRQS